MESITSADNKRIKYAVKLRTSSRQRRQDSLFFIEGLRLCYDAYLSEIKISTAFFTSDFIKKNEIKSEKIKNAAETSYLVSDAVMAKLCDTVTPQGIALICEIPKVTLNCKSGLYLGLENTADPSNIGAIARTAEAFGVNGIITSAAGCDPYSPKSLRASMGAFFRLPVLIAGDFLEKISEFKAKGAAVYTSVVDKNAAAVYNIDRSDFEVLIIGNEASGVTEAAKEIADKTVTIPMGGKAESLNASVAAAVMVYELTKE